MTHTSCENVGHGLRYWCTARLAEAPRQHFGEDFPETAALGFSEHQDDLEAFGGHRDRCCPRRLHVPCGSGS